MKEIIMSNMDGIIGIAVGLLGLFVGWLKSRKELPSIAKAWLDRVGEQQIRDAVNEAAQMAGKTPEERKTEAVRIIKERVAALLDDYIPTSIANLLVEWVYQKVMK